MNQPSIQNKIRLFESQNHCSLSIRVVFFDMDGVLFDSMPNHSYAWVSAFRKFGLEIPTREAYMNEGSTALFRVC